MIRKNIKKNIRQEKNNHISREHDRTAAKFQEPKMSN